MKKAHWVVLTGFAILVYFLRFSTLFQSVINWDETVFLLMGRSLLRGEIPYTTVWEHSPMGTPVLFALAQALLGQSVLSIRILTWVAVTTECFLLYLLGSSIGVGEPASRSRGVEVGVIAGLLYAAFSLNNGGLSAHRELMLAPFVTLAIILFLSARAGASGPARISSVRLLLIGLLLGFALQIKYLYVFEFIALWLIAMASLLFERRDGASGFLAEAVRYTVLLATGPVALVTLIGAYFASVGHFPDFLRTNFIAAAAYAQGESFSIHLALRKVLDQWYPNFLLWLSLILAPLYLLVVRDVDRRERRNLIYLLIWAGCAFVGVCFSGRFFDHYWLEMLPPLCSIAALIVVGLLRAYARPAAIGYGLALALVLAGPLHATMFAPLVSNAGLLYRHTFRGQAYPVDTAARVSAYLNDRVGQVDSIYVVDYEPVVYYLVNAKAPTKFVFPLFLILESSQGVPGIDPLRELRVIMDKQPRYVVRVNPPSRDLTNRAFAADVDSYLRASYALETSIPGADARTTQPISVEMYRRR